MKTADFNSDMIFKDGKPAINLILETNNTKEIRILMKKGQKMDKHQTPFPIIVHIISGNIDFGVNDEIHSLQAGAILSLEGSVPHNLFAKEDSVVRLSLAKQDKVSRVEFVANK